MRDRGDTQHGHNRANLSPRLTGTLLRTCSHTARAESQPGFYRSPSFGKIQLQPQVSDFITWKVKILKDSSWGQGVGTHAVFHVSSPRWSSAGHHGPDLGFRPPLPTAARPTTERAAFLKLALLLIVNGTREMSPLCHKAARILSRTYEDPVRKLCAHTAARPALASLPPRRAGQLFP